MPGYVQASHPSAAASWSSDDDPDAPRQAPQEEQLQTFMLLEYCDRGNLDHAMRSGKFRRKAESGPELVRLLAWVPFHVIH